MAATALVFLIVVKYFCVDTSALENTPCVACFLPRLRYSTLILASTPKELQAVTHYVPSPMCTGHHTSRTIISVYRDTRERVVWGWKSSKEHVTVTWEGKLVLNYAVASSMQC